jgi:hypothetical protein
LGNFTCPACGQKIKINGLGRKPLNIPLKNICEMLASCRDISTTAGKLGCSQGYIYNALKANRLKVKDIINHRSLL